MGGFLGNTLGKIQTHEGEICDDGKRVVEDLLTGNHDVQNDHHKDEIHLEH